MNELEIMWKIQQGHNKRFYDVEKFDNDKEYAYKVLKDYSLGMIEQTIKMLNCFDWKIHSLLRNEDVEGAKQQAVDVMKYSFGVLQFLGVETAHEFVDLYFDKSDMLEQKWEQDKIKYDTTTKVVVCDIDGCIADYSSSYELFLNQECNMKRVLEDRTNYSFHVAYGISKQAEEECYERFVLSGGFRNLHQIEGAGGVLRELKLAGFKIVLLTARPSWIWSRIYQDTIWWLSDNEIKYDMILWDKDKADSIVNNVFPANVVAMVEDRDKHAIEVSHLNIPVFLLDTSYNRGVTDTKYITRVMDWKEIIKRILE